MSGPVFQLDIANKLKEPVMPKSSESDLKQLHVRRYNFLGETKISPDSQ